jgi:hypothetical protein
VCTVTSVAEPEPGAEEPKKLPPGAGAVITAPAPFYSSKTLINFIEKVIIAIEVFFVNYYSFNTI